MKNSTYLVALLFCAGSAVSAIAQPDAEFAKANREYAQGNFKEAIASYEALVRADEWNANLFYDLGNAYFRMRDFGRAILNYERALALDQHHPEATNRARWSCNRPGWSVTSNSRASISTASLRRLLSGWEFSESSR
jgi:tetratricopeptide (TPR) repeat protein